MSDDALKNAKRDASSTLGIFTGDYNNKEALQAFHDQKIKIAYEQLAKMPEYTTPTTSTWGGIYEPPYKPKSAEKIYPENPTVKATDSTLSILFGVPFVFICSLYVIEWLTDVKMTANQKETLNIWFMFSLGAFLLFLIPFICTKISNYEILKSQQQNADPE